MGVLHKNLNELHPDNLEVTPAYVQKVGLYTEYFLTKWLGSPFNLAATHDDQTSIVVKQVESSIRILALKNNGETSPGWGFIKIKPGLREEEIQEDPPHELAHRIQFRYNDTRREDRPPNQLDILGIVREGGAILCTESINDALNRYVLQSVFVLNTPQQYSLAYYDEAGNYSGALLWKYFAEQHGANAGQAEGFETYRFILEETATVAANDPGDGYTIEALRRARLRMSRYGQWDRFSYQDVGRSELDSHETTWGNYLLANYLHGRGQPMGDRRFDYLEDDHPVKYFQGVGLFLRQFADPVQPPIASSSVKMTLLLIGRPLLSPGQRGMIESSRRPLLLLA